MDVWEIKYRPALKSDLKFLLDLRIQTMNQHLIASSLPVSDEAHLQRIEYQFVHATIIEINKCAIGLLKVHRQANNIELIQIQVAPSYQGKGIGTRILNDLIKEATESEKTITLSVLKTNPAKGLYLSVGFKIVGETDDSYLMLFEKRVSKQ
ncbi:GNAT family N-acetyltransferase [Sphingobacterium sp. CZ-UAM]|uniref:GNAT family N-acetyltransferase n=1 Tax=unclassified Sphingobacterium TaxID=2609468 RepID=UPI000985F60A|nr:GNAT family N-acetyltransferase [Sphingobacterium sp. CZ-UAM]OOG19362.1 GNAT family N-acetyltransferase [Sphingobacterium sp. CZ-UAM]